MELSVIIPVRNEEQSLPGLLDALAGQSNLAQEIIVVDTGSTDRTTEIADMHPVRLLSKPGAYPGVARNFGAEHASHPWLAFVDAGMHIEKNWLKELCTQAREKHADVVFANVQSIQNTFFRRCYFLAYAQLNVLPDRLDPPHGGCMLIRKSLWKQVGGYPPFRASEDRQFRMKVQGAAAQSQAFAMNSHVMWEAPASLSECFKKSLRYGYHDLLAGRWQDWHLGVLRIYLIMALAIRLGLPAWLTILGMTAARMAKRIHQKFHVSQLTGWQRIPAWFYSGIILISSDIAALASGAYYLLKHKIFRSPNPYHAIEAD